MGLDEDAAMEARCRALVAGVELPQPFCLEGFVAAVEERCGQNITLQPLAPDFGPEVSGVVGRTDSGYVLQYPQDSDGWFSLFGVSHECGHILGGHLAGDAQAVTAAAAHRAPADAGPASRVVLGGLVGAHLPDMQEAMAAWGPMYRCSMSEQVEREAELMATLFMQRIGSLLDADGGRPEDASGGPRAEPTSRAVLSRYAQALGGHKERRRGSGRTPAAR